MKRILQLAVLATIALSLNSCGLPAALGRSAGRVLSGVEGLTNQAMTTGF